MRTRLIEYNEQTDSKSLETWLAGSDNGYNAETREITENGFFEVVMYAGFELSPEKMDVLKKLYNPEGKEFMCLARFFDGFATAPVDD